MSGVSAALRAGDYAATVTGTAGALASLTYRGRDLVVPFAPGAPIPAFRGIVAAPWPNRLADGRYRAAGRDLAVPVTEPERGCALHGLALAREWDLVAHDGVTVAFALDLGPSEGYPFRLRLEVRYALSAGGLDWSVRAANVGEGRAPYGVCPHPYLVAGPSPLDSWELQVPGEAFLEVTPDRLLPLGTRTVEGHEFDFRESRTIGQTEIDHAFTRLRFDQGVARAVVRDPSGSGVVMEWDAGCPWVQVHTADRPAPAPSRLGVAVEPMTCPPNAFASGTDLVWLAPGEEHKTGWRIRALEG
ncbi:aldose 1-epimerase family protein [Sinomonas sp. R1AF57]|jgi:aldose 1-epimerase|uniref:aldose 1-epimerase family protein n=1 Tax=Sinomonas sp. R1AF57 TaxID=2020377 RepID=UPI000B6214DB|nr:aldose 1-epimerase family protein [Sinomonas sp. R1AF57]ASN50851.1 galactose mutarotase [Sinomonas sp. R1AF57]